jgi:hypothetical protein
VTRASRNLPDVRAVTPGGLNLLDVMKFHHLVLTRPAIEALTSQLLAEIRRGGAPSDDSAPVAMEQAAIAQVGAGAPADVAVADAAEQVAAADEDAKEES